MYIRESVRVLVRLLTYSVCVWRNACDDCVTCDGASVGRLVAKSQVQLRVLLVGCVTSLVVFLIIYPIAITIRCHLLHSIFAGSHES